MRRSQRSWILLLLLEIFTISSSFHSKKEALHAGYQEYVPSSRIKIQEFLLKSQQRRYSHQDLYETNFTHQHLLIQEFCSRTSCSWKEYYDLLHHLRESHETSDDLGLSDLEHISIQGIQDSSIYLSSWNPQECEVITEPSSQLFYEYVQTSRPFVIKGIAKDWLALKKWNLVYLEKLLRDLEIYVGASPSGDFVGPEPSSLWNFTDEEVIFSKPAHFFLPFSQLIESYRRKIMSRRKSSLQMNLFEEESQSNDENDEDDPTSLNFVPFKNTTLYMEYYPIDRLHPSLTSDLGTLPWTSFLSLLMQLVWMGGGDDPKTSPLHFDKFENIMIMIAGSKEFKLFPPSQSEYVYGDELSRGGKLTIVPIYYPGTKKIIDLKFERLRSDIDPVRSHSTYTMVDLDRLNLTRFPLVRRAKMITCHIHEGDLLYVPSHWWHDVTSYDDKEGKSIGINHFFEPFYHLPGGRSRSLHHTLSEYYSPLRNKDLFWIELCEDKEGMVCFREQSGSKKKRKKKPNGKRGSSKNKKKKKIGKRNPKTRRKSIRSDL